MSRPYSTARLLEAFQDMRTVDSEFGRDPHAYLSSCGIPEDAIELAFQLADDSWKLTKGRLGITDDNPLAELFRDEYRQAIAAGALRGLCVGEQLGRDR